MTFTVRPAGCAVAGPRAGRVYRLAGLPGAGEPRRPLPRAAMRLRGEGGARAQPRVTPKAASAVLTGWKKVVPPEVQSPLPPEVRPSAVLPA